MTKPIEQVDVLIVGSGPAGTSTALHLLKQDPNWASRVVIVDKAIHPREKLCGGGVTHLGSNTLAHLGLSFEPNHFVVRETRLVYKDLHYSFWGNPVFRVTRRDEFDHWLVKKVEERGIPVRQGEAVKDIVPGDDYVTVTTTKAEFQAKVVVAADGSKSFVRTRLKWEDDSRVARLLEVGARNSLIPSTGGGYRNEWDSVLRASGTTVGFASTANAYDVRMSIRAFGSA